MSDEDVVRGERLLFRNVDFDESSPMDTWPTEAVATAIERGSLTYWSRLARAIEADPWGPLAHTVEEVLDCAQPYGVAAGLRRAIVNARAVRMAAEKQQVAEQLRAAVTRSGLTRAEFASRLGTSTSRLSTYLTGKVVPAGTLMLRAEQIADR